METHPPLSTFTTTQYIFLPLLDLNWHIIITQVHSLEDTLGIEHSMGFDKCIMTCVCHCGIIRNNFSALKFHCVLSIHPSHPSTPGNHHSALFFYDSAFLKEFFNLIFILYWGIVDLQCCVTFMNTAKWFSYTYIYIYIHSFSDFFPI